MSTTLTSLADPAGRQRTTLIVLLLIFICNYLDRQILSVLIPQIKLEFGLSDSRLGLLTGISFALFYVIAGIPLARMADNGSRVNLLSVCIATWSLCTALCAAATGFWTLLLARIGVGVGEAGCSPTAHSLIADHFPMETRAFALAVYSTAVPVASLIGLAGGAWLAEQFGWRLTLVVVGLPGILLAVVAKRLLVEPARSGGSAAGHRLGECLAYLGRTRSLALMALAAAFESFAGFGTMMWLPSYFDRASHLGMTQIGLLLGAATGVLGIVGILGAGLIADRLGRRNRRWNCLLPATVTGIVCLSQGMAFLFADPVAALPFLILPLLALGASGGPINAAVQSVAPMRMRVTAAALLMLVLNLIGYGLGPTFVGVASDTLATTIGADSLRIALLCVTGGYALAALLYLAASTVFVADIDRARRFDADRAGQPIE
ncbi:spinster family MFS transporter [Sphingomonas colocasiae]|uniref:MFS transporter n=1 Tax=Sphingomonas colocasiae TaxID=1848973 RepID=A0ABS7PQQ8_9SPHN|nr:MFS transporter [Sphingomonas colocasiae]MBY8823563.1 MFS transporter [Sphingomonas colocasiae]